MKKKKNGEIGWLGNQRRRRGKLNRGVYSPSFLDLARVGASFRFMLVKRLGLGVVLLPLYIYIYINIYYVYQTAKCKKILNRRQGDRRNTGLAQLISAQPKSRENETQPSTRGNEKNGGRQVKLSSRMKKVRKTHTRKKKDEKYLEGGRTKNSRLRVLVRGCSTL